MPQVLLSHLDYFGALCPLFLALLLFMYLSTASKDKDATFYNFFYYLNPRLGLASQWPLRFWLILIVFYFFATGIVCWGNYHLAFTSAGFETFIEISKFPIAVLSLTLPVGLFISRLHSTQQTAVQIETSDIKNRLDSFHGQRKGIVEYIDSIGEIELAPGITMKLKVNQAFHAIIFSNSTHLQGANEANEEAINFVTSMIETALGHLAMVMEKIAPLASRRQTSTQMDTDLHYIHLVHETKRLCDYLKVSDYTRAPEQTDYSVEMKYVDAQNKIQHMQLEAPATTYYSMLAILNYCCTITYYAATSEHRSKGSAKLQKLALLYEDIRSLSFANKGNVGHDKIAMYSRLGVFIQHDKLKFLPARMKP